MRIVLACCGLFHYRRPFLILSSKGVLSQFIFSHKFSSYRGVATAFNIPLKEYLIRLLQRFIPDRYHAYAFPWIHDYWDYRAARILGSGDLLHVMGHGTSNRLIQAARRKGMRVVGEAVNSHPLNYYDVTRSESLNCGINVSSNYPKQLTRIEREIWMYDVLMVPSQYVKQSFVERGYPTDRIVVNPFGVDLSVFSSPPSWSHRKSGKFVVVCVAQVIPRKGIRVLLDAWRLANFNNGTAELRVIGRISDEMKQVLDCAPPGVFFMGAMPRVAVVAELQNSSVYILPTIEEGFAVSILEAMATGCAVITTPASGATAIIMDGENGFIHASSDAVAFARTLHMLFNDRELVVKIGLAAIQSVKCGFTWDDYCNRSQSVYENVLKGVSVL